MKAKSSFNNRGKSLLLGLLLPCLIAGGLFVAPKSGAQLTDEEANRQTFPSDVPAQIDVRGGTPRAVVSNGLFVGAENGVTFTALQTKALGTLQDVVGGNAKLNIRYNGLTGTPMSISNPSGYLTNPSNAAPEQIARDFVRQYRELFKFDENDLNNLKLQSRATSAEGITILLFNQQKNGLPLYHGDVLVNVSKNGQIISVGGDSFPRLKIINANQISAGQAVSFAATSLGISNYSPQSLGATQILNTYGDLPQEYVTGEKFSGAGVFSDDIAVQPIVFPLGNTGRLAYKFNLTTPQYHNIVWENVVDAQTGAILRRISLTAYFGEPGGGTGANRRGTFRPDVQNLVEGNNSNGTAQGRVFDSTLR